MLDACSDDLAAGCIAFEAGQLLLALRAEVAGASGAAVSADVRSNERIEARLPAAAPVALVVTARGDLVHRVDCRLVAGRPGLRPVTAVGSRRACQLCLPPRGGDWGHDRTRDREPAVAISGEVDAGGGGR